MDVKRGFCWRCLIPIGSNPKTCSSCLIAAYCSKSCLSDDLTRHGCVECPMWSTKKCGNCGKLGRCSECSGCYSIWYCNSACQKSHWINHKIECKLWKQRVITTASLKADTLKDLPISFQSSDFPFYFGTSCACDLLYLNNNEMKDGSQTERHYSNYNILLPACGDLRHLIHTIYALPNNFHGNLNFLLNDMDPFVMARNVLFLYMMASCKLEEAQQIVTILLSLRLHGQDFSLLQRSLESLESMDHEQVLNTTHGVVNIPEDHFDALHDIWINWRRMPCFTEDAICIQLDQERKEIFSADPGVVTGLPTYLLNVPKQHVSSIKKYMDDGIITPTEQNRLNLPYYNPTLTGRPRALGNDARTRPASSWTFQYCVRSDCIPFQCWDYLEMVKVKDCNSITIMTHAFVTKSVRNAMKCMHEKHITIDINTDDFVNLKATVSENKKFDRIFTNNLADYYGNNFIIQCLGSLLSTQNSNAILFTELHNWQIFMDEASFPCDDMVIDVLRKCAMKDNNLKNVAETILKNQAFYTEYYNNVPHFINYLRAEHMAISINFTSARRAGQKIPPVTKLDEVVECHGFTLRDFRRERNRVIPFAYRVNARAIQMLRGFVRHLEWVVTNQL